MSVIVWKGIVYILIDALGGFGVNTERNVGSSMRTEDIWIK
jgi:hypothetical protein